MILERNSFCFTDISATTPKDFGFLFIIAF